MSETSKSKKPKIDIPMTIITFNVDKYSFDLNMWKVRMKKKFNAKFSEETVKTVTFIGKSNTIILNKI